MWRNLWKSRGNYVDRAVNHGVIRVRRVWKTFFAWVFQRILILSTEILRLRHTLWLPLEGKLRPQAVMRCRFRSAKPFFGEKCYFMLRNALSRYTSSGGCATTFPSRGRLTVGFRFSDREFPTASKPTRFSFSEKEKLRKRKTAQGTAPRSEIHYVAAGEAATQ